GLRYGKYEKKHRFSSFLSGAKSDVRDGKGYLIGNYGCVARCGKPFERSMTHCGNAGAFRDARPRVIAHCFSAPILYPSYIVPTQGALFCCGWGQGGPSKPAFVSLVTRGSGTGAPLPACGSASAPATTIAAGFVAAKRSASTSIIGGPAVKSGR